MTKQSDEFYYLNLVFQRALYRYADGMCLSDSHSPIVALAIIETEIDRFRQTRHCLESCVFDHLRKNKINLRDKILSYDFDTLITMESI